MINTEKFNSIVEAAKAKAANDPKWLHAIEKAAAGILDGSLIVTVLAHGALVTGKNGSHYANGRCDCEASRRGHTQCYHRAGARLMEKTTMLPKWRPLPPKSLRQIATSQRQGMRLLQRLPNPGPRPSRRWPSN